MDVRSVESERSARRLYLHSSRGSRAETTLRELHARNRGDIEPRNAMWPSVTPAARAGSPDVRRYPRARRLWADGCERVRKRGEHVCCELVSRIHLLHLGRLFFRSRSRRHPNYLKFFRLNPTPEIYAGVFVIMQCYERCFRFSEIVSCFSFFMIDSNPRWLLWLFYNRILLCIIIEFLSPNENKLLTICTYKKILSLLLYKLKKIIHEGHCILKGNHYSYLLRYSISLYQLCIL